MACQKNILFTFLQCCRKVAFFETIMLVFKESKVKSWLTNSCALSGPIETKCLMNVKA